MAATSKVPINEFAQCGGQGGVCAILGTCADAPLPDRRCIKGTTCQKQDTWYWQVRDDGQPVGF